MTTTPPPRTRAKTLALAAALALAGRAAGQEYSFVRYSLQEGLSQSQVLDIRQDILGRMWIATERGGVTILSGDYPIYLGRNDGLPGGETLSLFRDRDGRMWVGTSRGVRYHDGRRLARPRGGELLDTMYVWSIDQRTDGTVALATSHGVYGYDDRRGCHVLIPELAGQPVTRVTARSNNLLYVMPYNHPPYLYDGHTLDRLEAPLPRGASAEACLFDSRDRLWIGTTRGLVLRQGYGYATLGARDGLADDHVLSLAEDRDGNIWAGTDGGGISVISPDGRITNITESQGVGHSRINALYQDRYQNMWVGTDGGGAYVFRGFQFQKMQLPELPATASVTATHQTPGGDLCLGTNGHGLLVISPEGGRRLYTVHNGLSNNTVRAISSDRAGRIFAGTDTGLDLIERGEVAHNFAFGQRVRPPVSALALSSDGQLWAGTPGHGVYALDTLGNTRHYTAQGDGLAGDQVNGLSADAQGRVYISTATGLTVASGGGLQSYSRGDGRFGFAAQAAVPLPDGRLWVASPGGVSVFTGSGFPYTPLETFSDATLITSAVADGLGGVVLGTEKGIDVVEGGPRSRVRAKARYRQHDGFFGIECNPNAATRLATGQILLGTKQGATLYDPAAARSHEPPTRAYVREVELFYRKVDWRAYADSIEPWTMLPASLTLPHGQNNLTFYFGANDYLSPQNLRLQFYLEGYDPEWQPPTARRFANYTNLPPGDYSMNVRAWYPSGEQVGEHASFRFTIDSPIYARPWFMAAAVAAFLLAGGMAWRGRVRQVRANERRLKTLVAERTRDLTQQQQELREANAKITQSSRMKEQFLANTSHEIRTPLNVIVGYTNLLLNTPVAPEQRGYLNNIKESSQNLSVIVNDILDFSKIEADKLELDEVPFDFVKSIRATGNHLQLEAARKGLQLETIFTGVRHNVILGDPVRLNQMITNLVKNAIKFTPQGRIEIAVVDQSTDSQVVDLQISVSDTGIGIPADKQSDIFESFTQATNDTTRKYGGTGLGLTIVKRLVEKQGGTIALESHEGLGSRFTINLMFPASDADPVEESRLDYTIAPHRLARGLRVLIVDDNDINLALAENTLRTFSQQFEIETAGNGREAVQKVKSTSYDLVIMDIQMPEMDGYAATRAIRSTLPAPRRGVPILGMTAHAMRGERDRCAESGMDGYVSKPFAPRALFEQILRLTGVKAEPLPQQPDAQPPTQAPSFAGLDPRQLWKNAAERPDRMARYLKMYLQAVPGQIDALRKALDTNQRGEARTAAHTLKTSFGYLGMPAANKAALEIERSCDAGQGPLQPGEHHQRMATIEERWGNVVNELENYVQRAERNKKE